MKTKLLCVICILSIAGCGNSRDVQTQNEVGFRFEVSFSPEAHPQEITGKVYVMISKDDKREPRFQTGPTGVPIWGESINSLEPSEPAVINQNSFGYPLKRINEIPPGEYYVQGFVNIYTEFKRTDGHAIWMHQDQWEGQHWNRSPGNLYSDVRKIKIDPAENQVIKIKCNHVIPPVEIPADTKWVKRVKFQSKILTDFWGQPQYLGATILLPKGYDDNPDTYYPVNYIQGHFSLRAPYGFTDQPPEPNQRWRGGYDLYKYWTSDDCPPMIAVTFQHPCPYYDDSYAVNSENVGPYGDAIMQELIPYLEEHFRIIREPYARLLSGGSTGGWIALALQIFHPDFFGGTWALCPDPVDFRYYQIVNVYDDENAYYKIYDWMKIERPDNRATDGSIRYTMKNENHYELVIGDNSRGGGQWDIWEAVFSPVGKDGYPKPIWDKYNGKIDHEVAQYWKEHYDLRYYLEQNWANIGASLQGKLHIYTGDMDTYYLNNAVKYLEEFLEQTTNPHYDGTVEYGDGQPHCWGPRGADLIQRMYQYFMQKRKD